MQRRFAIGACSAVLIAFVATMLAVLITTPTPSRAQQVGPVYCSQMAVSATGFTTKVQVVAPAAGGSARIFVCGATISAVAASVVTFQYGTGSNCASGSTAIGPTIQLGATSTYDDGAAVWRGFLVPNPNALCMTATAAANAAIYYSLQ